MQLENMINEHDVLASGSCSDNNASKGCCIDMQSEATLTIITLCWTTTAENLFYNSANITVHSSYDAFKDLGCSRVHPTVLLQLARCCGVRRYLGILCIDGTNGAMLEHKFEPCNIVPVVCCVCSQVHGCPALEQNTARFDLLPNSKVHACRANLRGPMHG